MRIFDDTSPGNPLANFKLAAEFSKLKKERTTIESLTDSPSRLRLLKIGVRIRAIMQALGKRPAPAAQVTAPATIPALPQGTPATDTAKFYPEEGKRTKGQRQKDNNAAIKLLAKIEAGEVAVTDAEREVLAKYSGNGGGLTDANGLTGSPYEYYTPKPIAGAVWDLLKEMGFQGGAVLDPSAGSGVFTAMRPASAVMTQVELDSTSGAINGAINDGPTVSTTISPFEAVAAATPDEIYDAVITNVPFGDLAMRGDNPEKDKRFQKANLQEYFILRSLQKLRPNGLAAFIVPKSIVSGLSSKESKLRLTASMMAEFVGAYRLPNSIFTTAAADVTTDLIVFRKFSREVALKITELQQQNPAVLSESNVLWDQFLTGKYFAGEGRKYILGEEGTTSGKFGEVAAVINDDTIANIAKLIKRFPKSHINWEVLSAAETTPIVYADGDAIHSSGQTLEFKAGEWIALDSNAAEDKSMQAIAPKLQTPLACVNNGITWAQAQQWLAYEGIKGRHLSIPSWLVAVKKASDAVPESEFQTWWEAISAGLAVMGLMQESSSVEPYNYKDGYPILSAQLVRVQAYGNKTFGRASKLIKDGLLSIRNARAKGAYTPFWLGEIRASQEAVELTPTQLYEKVKYEAEDESGYVSVERLRAAMPDFDPLENDEWCVSADGKSVTHANDYYSGSYAEFVKVAAAELAVCEDPAIRAKLVKQHDAAKERLNIVDVSTMTFSLFTPHISMLQKLEFMRAYVSTDIFLTTDANGRDVFDIKQPSLPKYASEEDAAIHKAMQRFVKGYLKNQNITTQSKATDVEDDPTKEAALVQRIKEIADKAKAQFDAWARANEEIQVGLNNRLNSPEALRFVSEPDGTPLDIPNLNVAEFKPHPYQYGAVRTYSRNFAGVLGFDVGLGKTLTALAAVQYCQSIGVKRKTGFVVPNATLTNWKKEAGKAYLDTSDCLFVGLVVGKNGKGKIDPAQVKADLNAIRENRHAKIFMTLEAFKMIPVRDETMQAYITYLAENDDAYLLAEDDASKKKANIAADAKSKNVKATGEKSGAIPFFEDMGIDSLVLDEAHNYKNSKMTSSQFKGAKYLADPSKSQRGMDMQAKAWFVRGLSPRNDGVLGLTATPVTNSPLEVYAMLTLVLGEREVNTMYGVTGADSFMAGACEIEERDEENIVGILRPVRVFGGLQNAGLLRRLLKTAAIIKTAEDVKADGLNISVPDADEVETSVDIGTSSFNKIIAYKEEYILAVKAVMAGGASAQDKLTGSPFNLIRKMTKVINDPELDSGVFVFKHGKTQGEAAAKAIAAFNAKNIVEERDYTDANAAPADIRTRITKDVETGEAVTKFLITVRARANGNSVEVLSTDYATQEALLKMLAATGIEPSVNISPKLAAVIENFRNEAATPRWMGQAKQIIFCDELSLHHKIKLALTQAVGVPASKIKIVNAVSVDTAGMQEVQDGFNGDGEENKYTVIIANKKAEVGINLQKGTQAIHHMTIGWTPDSIHQRNGRGVRQGNPVGKVNVYHYDGEGTFDGYKRKLVGIKADWIGSLMSGDSSSIKIEGDMSKEDYEMLANAVGDASAMGRISEEIEARNKRQKQAAMKVSQLQSLRIIEAQDKWLSSFGAVEGRTMEGFVAWIKSKLLTAGQTRAAINALNVRLSETEGPILAARLKKQIEELQIKRTEQLSMLDGLPRDSAGTPVAPTSSYGNVSDDMMKTVAYQNWQKAVSIAGRMKEEAAVGFLARASEGYSKDALDAFNAGEAEIVAGTLAVAGSFVMHEGVLMVVRKPGIQRGSGKELVAFNPATQTDTALLRMTGAKFIARGSADWGTAVQSAVALDEAKIALTTAGFAANSTYLFTSFVDDVRDSLSVPIPSQGLSVDSFTFRAPLFPYPLREQAAGDELTTAIKAEQAKLVKSYDRYGYMILNDIRDVGASGHTTFDARVKALRVYAVAHKMRATEADLQAILAVNTNRTLDALGILGNFMSALPGGVAVVKSPEELDVWAMEWLAANQDFVQIESLDIALGYRIANYRAVANKIDDGKERWFKVGMDQKYALQTPAVDVIKAAVENGLLTDAFVSESSSYSLPTYFMSEHGKTLAGLLFAETGEYLELKVGIAETRSSMSLNGSSRLYAENWGDAVSLVGFYLRATWNAMKASAKKYKAMQAVDSAGIDLVGILAALNNIPGILLATVGMADEMKPVDRYSASYFYKANEYVLLKTVRGSETHEKIASAGAAGLQGRSFDNVKKAFRVCLEDGEKFSDGKPVASVSTLFAHLNLNIKDYIL